MSCGQKTSIFWPQFKVDNIWMTFYITYKYAWGLFRGLNSTIDSRPSYGAFLWQRVLVSIFISRLTIIEYDFITSAFYINKKGIA
jgi:hypothetical protein